MVFEKKMSVKDLIEQMRKELQEEKGVLQVALPKKAKASKPAKVKKAAKKKGKAPKKAAKKKRK